MKIQLEENKSKYYDLLSHTDVKWLSRWGFLERFQELLPEIIQFFDSRGERYDQLSKRFLKNYKSLNSVSEKFKFNTAFDLRLEELSDFENRFQGIEDIFFRKSET